MSLSQEWRRFTFFEREEVKTEENENPLEKLKEMVPTCSSSGRLWISIGDNEGFIYLIDSQHDITSFKAFNHKCHLLKQLKQQHILVSLGLDEEKDGCVLKSWNLDKMDRAGIPTCCRVVKLLSFCDNITSKITCMGVDECGGEVGVGFESGGVLLLTGDVCKERNPKGKYVYNGEYPITSLTFNNNNNNNNNNNKEGFLFITTRHEVTQVSLDNKKQTVLSSKGCREMCSAITSTFNGSQFVLARTDAVYFFENDSMGACLAFEGEKIQLHWFKGYMVIVAMDNTNINQRGNFSSFHEQQQDNNTQQHREMNIVTVYDIGNRFIAFSHPFNKVLNVFVEGSSLVVLTRDFKLYKLKELDIQSKLAILFKKSLYNDAINLARHHDKEGLTDIYKHYGDHLYNKADHDGAMQQYIKTIGSLEPSYVIRKFLDASRIDNLTTYLEHLHNQPTNQPPNSNQLPNQLINHKPPSNHRRVVKEGDGVVPSEEHTTLLLNCFTKMKNEEKLNDFITSGKYHLDADTTVRVCRSAGYFKQALCIAHKNKMSDWILRIQLEDMKDYEEALKHISSLSPSQAEHYIGKYGRELMKSLPSLTTQHIKNLCSRHVNEDGVEVEGVRAEVVVDVFVDQPSMMSSFLTHVIQTEAKVSCKVYNSLLEVLLHEYTTLEDVEKKEEKGKEIVLFLKDHKMSYEFEVALMLCQLNSFDPGLLYLHEETHCYQEILNSYMKSNNYTQVIETCCKYGSKDTNLWLEALKYFVKEYHNPQQEHNNNEKNNKINNNNNNNNNNNINNNYNNNNNNNSCLNCIKTAMKHIEKHNLLPALSVVQLLSSNHHITLDVAKEYILGVVCREKAEIEYNEKQVTLNTERCNSMRQEILAANTQARIMQNQKCSVCGHLLDLPCLHSYCGHSFHQHCFDSYSENSSDCPICSPENKKVLDSLRQMDTNRHLNENFIRQMNISVITGNKTSVDGFSVVADYFGKGLFNKSTKEMK